MGELNNTIRVSVNGMPGPEMEGRVSSGQTILPGHLIALGPNGEYYPHNAGNEESRPIMVAVEDRLIGLTVNDIYTQDLQVKFVVARPGDVLQLRSSKPVVVGDYVSPDGGADKGLVQVSNGNNPDQIGIALEAQPVVGDLFKVLIG